MPRTLMLTDVEAAYADSRPCPSNPGRLVQPRSVYRGTGITPLGERLLLLFISLLLLSGAIILLHAEVQADFYKEQDKSDLMLLCFSHLHILTGMFMMM